MKKLLIFFSIVIGFALVHGTEVQAKNQTQSTVSPIPLDTDSCARRCNECGYRCKWDRDCVQTCYSANEACCEALGKKGRYHTCACE